ncbi:unnamed protein product [Haemonchus placei]|uniref:Biogenesis of lysosome-related organelles complex 1 subunit 2 n=1 Tax=Haemonchus placei TaxID=6290 RepID=A0A0N4WP42_HAEPC|nr:unnamed protein product [Haemonchus placei]
MIQSEISNADCALEKYVKTADDLSSDIPRLDEILQKVQSNSVAAQELLQTARTAITTLNVLYVELQEAEECTSGLQKMKMAKIKLAPIPIPKFSGKIWEWETFWGAFEHSVHSQDIDDIYKMNYLLNALQGEAKESTKQFEI